jgi:hypothetical protein
LDAPSPPDLRNVFGSFGMIMLGAFVWRDAMAASELIRSGTALLTVILSSYVFGAVADDYFQKGNDHGE